MADKENPLEGLMEIMRMAGKFFEPGGPDIWSQVTGQAKASAPKDTPADAAAARDKLLFSELSKISESLGDVLLELKAIRQAVTKPKEVEPGSAPRSITDPKFWN